MKNPFDSIKNMLGINKKPGAQMDYDIASEQRDIDRKLAVKEKRQKQVSECAAVLRECRFTFQKTITVENALAGDMRRKGYDTTKQKTRVREAAVGILVVDQALYELQSINSEADMNSAMNKMGMALRQLRRLDNSTTAISGSTERILRKWYPSALEEEGQAEVNAANTATEIPPEMRDKIDEAFVQNLMFGDSYEMCMAKASMAPRNTDPTRSQRDEMMEELRRAIPDDEPHDDNADEIVRMHTNKF